MTDLRSEIDYLHSILELLGEIREGLGRIEAAITHPTVIIPGKGDSVFRGNFAAVKRETLKDASLSVRKEEGEDVG